MSLTSVMYNYYRQLLGGNTVVVLIMMVNIICIIYFNFLKDSHTHTHVG